MDFSESGNRRPLICENQLIDQRLDCQSNQSSVQMKGHGGEPSPKRPRLPMSSATPAPTSSPAGEGSERSSLDSSAAGQAAAVTALLRGNNYTSITNTNNNTNQLGNSSINTANTPAGLVVTNNNNIVQGQQQQALGFQRAAPVAAQLPQHSTAHILHNAAGMNSHQTALANQYLQQEEHRRLSAILLQQQAGNQLALNGLLNPLPTPQQQQQSLRHALATSDALRLQQSIAQAQFAEQQARATAMQQQLLLRQQQQQQQAFNLTGNAHRQPTLNALALAHSLDISARSQDHSSASGSVGDTAAMLGQGKASSFISSPGVDSAAKEILFSNAAASGRQRYASTLSAPPAVSYRPSPSEGCKTLELETDVEQLSDYQVLVRQHLEVFEAKDEDVQSNKQGRKKQVFLGQVGLRCLHCADMPLRQRGRGAVYYPTKLSGVYQASQNQASSHLCEACPRIPDTIKERLRVLRDRRETAGGGKQYWAEGVESLGVYETPEGLRFGKGPERNSEDEAAEQRDASV